MWSSRSLSGLQKTYDECYLKCSTAVYYESQGDEKEATLCWKNALDQIRISTATRKHNDRGPKSETERTLVQSLHELEVQCKERIDLLEALRLSRQDLTQNGHKQGALDSEPNPQPDPRPDDSPPKPGTPKGWIGDGTIPAITYTELSRPPLPQRPSLGASVASRGSSELRRHSTDRLLFPSSEASSSSARGPSLPPYGTRPAAATVPRASPKSTSPERHTMRTTLRSGGKSDKPSRSSRNTPSSATKGPGASKAATLAWTARSSHSRASLDSSVALDVRQSSSPHPVAEPRLSDDNSTRRSLSTQPSYWNSHTRRLVATPIAPAQSNPDLHSDMEAAAPRVSGDYNLDMPSPLALGAASSALNALSMQDRTTPNSAGKRRQVPKRTTNSEDQSANYSSSSSRAPRTAPKRSTFPERGSGAEDDFTAEPNSLRRRGKPRTSHQPEAESTSSGEDKARTDWLQARSKGKEKALPIVDDPDAPSSSDNTTTKDLTINTTNTSNTTKTNTKNEWELKKKRVLKSLPPGVDASAAKAIFNEIVVEGDTVHWSDVAGLEIAKKALKEAVVYPFLRPDLFMGLREPARGMLLFGPPGTGKTMLARAVATESKSTFFSVSASSLTSKYLGESEKLVRALFALAKVMAPSIIFVDEIDSLLSQRSGSGDHESTRRIKTEFLIQWSDLQRAAAGRESAGDANRVLVLAATNLPWAIDEAARRRFVRRQYIPLPEPETRAEQLRTLLGQQKHGLSGGDIEELVVLTDGFSGSDITALAKDAAMGPLRSLGEALLHMTMDQIRPIELGDFKASLGTIRPSVNQEGLKEYEDWAKQFGERGG